MHVFSKFPAQAAPLVFMRLHVLYYTFKKLNFAGLSQYVRGQKVDNVGELNIFSMRIMWIIIIIFSIASKYIRYKVSPFRVALCIILNAN